MAPLFRTKRHRKCVKGYSKTSSPSRKDVRRRPTLPHSLPCSTIGAEGLSFRVRNGAGRFPFAMTAETLWRCQSSRPYLGNCTVDANTHEIFGCVSSCRLISTSQLHALLHFHVWPINPVV